MQNWPKVGKLMAVPVKIHNIKINCFKIPHFPPDCSKEYIEKCKIDCIINSTNMNRVRKLECDHSCFVGLARGISLPRVSQSRVLFHVLPSTRIIEL